jgi:tetrahydromethanopterin S-methyltransferase subunit G
MGEISAESITMKILEAIGEVKASVAGLVSDVTYMRRRVDDLWSKVDEIERSKATRVDLQDVEIRTEKTIAGLKAQLTSDLSRIDNDKIGHDQFSVDGFDNFSERLDAIEHKIDALTGAEKELAAVKERVEELQQLKWKIVGGAAALLSAGAVVGWILHEAAGLIGR